MNHYSMSLSLYLRNQHTSFEKCTEKLNIGILNNNRNKPLDIIKLTLLTLTSTFTDLFCSNYIFTKWNQNKMKSFVFKAYDTFVGSQLSGSSTIYPNTHWLNQK